MLDLLLADVTAGPVAEVCILECPLVIYITINSKEVLWLFKGFSIQWCPIVDGILGTNIKC